MAEAFDNKSSRKHEILTMPQRIKILADGIVDTIGRDDPKRPDTVKNADWVDLHTNTSLKLQRKYVGLDEHYFINQFDTPQYQAGMKPDRQYYINSRNKYDVARYFASTEHDGPTPEEANSDPTEEVYDLLMRGPLKNSQEILDEQEEAEVDDRFLHLIGAYALSNQAIIERINRAYDIDYQALHERRLADIVKGLVYPYKKAGFNEEYAYQAIDRYWRSGNHSAIIVRPKKQ